MLNGKLESDTYPTILAPQYIHIEAKYGGVGVGIHYKMNTKSDTYPTIRGLDMKILGGEYGGVGVGFYTPTKAPL